MVHDCSASAECREFIRNLPYKELLEILEGGPSYPAALVGGLIRSENPYFSEDGFELTEDALKKRVTCGEFRGMSAEHPYDPGVDGPIPAPLDRGSETWHWSTKRRPADIPDYPTPELEARVVVKEIEITYAPEVPGTTQKPHLLILYSGGNSGGPVAP
jgi:hypothetical protein